MNIKILAIIFLLLLLIVITWFVKQDKIIVKYAIIWYLSIIIMLLFTIIPSLLSWTTSLFGIELASNFIFICLIGLLFIISISLTIIVSKEKEQIKTLIQEVSILKSKEK